MHQITALAFGGRELTVLSSGNYADEFDSVAMGNLSISPLLAMQSEPVMLDQDGRRRQFKDSYEVSHGGRAPGIRLLSIQ